MTQAAQRLATYEDLFDLPDNVIGQIIHGQLIVQPRPAPKHALANSGVLFDIGNPYHRGRGGPGGWWILYEPELHLDRHILVPDIAGWRRERMSSLPETAYFTIVPDWICEILSPGTAKLDRISKMPIYAEQGVGWLWLIDPDIRTLEVYCLNKAHWQLEATWQDAAEVKAPPFAEIVIALNDWWAPAG